MRKWVILIAVVSAVFAVALDSTEAAGRRRGCRPVYYCQPCCPVVGPTAAAPFAPYRMVTINGKAYQVHRGTDGGIKDIEEVEAGTFALARGANIPTTDVFTGKVRRIAKTNILPGNPKSFASISALRASLPSDDDMIARNIGRGPGVDRVDVENRNVSVTAFIYTFRKESDNDYHVILGDDPASGNPRFLNAEVSGIPVAGSDENRNKLWTVRKLFKQTFELQDDGPDKYDPLDPPVKVQITGALFYDVEHVPPHTVGPNAFSPKTAWEIHPISEIKFLD
jgi:hypothetical protein